MKFLALLIALAALGACAAHAPVPSAPPMIGLPEPLPAGVTPLTVEQDRQISQG